MLSLLNSEEAVKYFLNDLIYLPDERYRILANYIADYYVKNHDLNIANLYSTEDENINKTLNEVLNAFKDLPKYNHHLAFYQLILYYNQLQMLNIYLFLLQHFRELLLPFLSSPFNIAIIIKITPLTIATSAKLKIGKL